MRQQTADDKQISLQSDGLSKKLTAVVCLLGLSLVGVVGCGKANDLAPVTTGPNANFDQTKPTAPLTCFEKYRVLADQRQLNFVGSLNPNVNFGTDLLNFTIAKRFPLQFYWLWLLVYFWYSSW
jgi:hypothetical protein